MANLHDYCQTARDCQLASLVISAVTGKMWDGAASGLVLVLILFTLFDSFVHEARTSEVAPGAKFHALVSPAGVWRILAPPAFVAVECRRACPSGGRTMPLW